MVKVATAITAVFKNFIVIVTPVKKSRSKMITSKAKRYYSPLIAGRNGIIPPLISLCHYTNKAQWSPAIPVPEKIRNSKKSTKWFTI